MSSFYQREKISEFLFVQMPTHMSQAQSLETGPFAASQLMLLKATEQSAC